MAAVTYEQAIDAAAAIYRAWQEEAAYQTAEEIADAALVPGGPSREELIARVHEMRAGHRSNAA